jgi:hypothetical protein
MDRLVEFDPALKAVHPADRRFDGSQSIKLDPEDFADARPLHELGPAAPFRQIVKFDRELQSSAAPNLDLRADRIAPCPLL